MQGRARGENIKQFFCSLWGVIMGAGEVERLGWVAMVAMVATVMYADGVLVARTGRGSCAPSQSWVLLAAALAARRWSRPDRPARRG